MGNKVKKAVIACGGKGTRFLPLTRAMPKELIPVVDRPCLDYIIEEVVNSGITDILIVINPQKEVLRQYLEGDLKLYCELMDKNLPKLASQCLDLSGAKFSFVIQKEPLGTADAVSYAKDFCDCPFALLWGDDIICHKTPIIRQLIDCFERTNASVVGCQEILTPDITKYGVVVPKRHLDNKLCEIDYIHEKPALAEIPSNLVNMGRYIMTLDVFDAVEKTGFVNQEKRFTDTINILAKKSSVYAYQFEGVRYDMGDKLGALKAIVDFALKHPTLNEDFYKYLQKIT